MIAAFDVACSCGKATVLTMNDDGSCTTDDPTWQHHKGQDGSKRIRFWNCGGEDHEQASLKKKVD